VRLAVNKGYKILEIQEVHQYEVAQYNPDTGDGGLENQAISLIFQAELSGVTVNSVQCLSNS